MGARPSRTRLQACGRDPNDAGITPPPLRARRPRGPPFTTKPPPASIPITPTDAASPRSATATTITIVPAIIHSQKTRMTFARGCCTPTSRTTGTLISQPRRAPSRRQEWLKTTPSPSGCKMLTVFCLTLWSRRFTLRMGRARVRRLGHAQSPRISSHIPSRNGMTSLKRRNTPWYLAFALCRMDELPELAKMGSYMPTIHCRPTKLCASRIN